MLESYDDILTVDEACEALKIGKNALYDLLNSGTLKAMRNGRVWRIPKTAVQEYIVKAAGGAVKSYAQTCLQTLAE